MRWCRNALAIVLIVVLAAFGRGEKQQEKPLPDQVTLQLKWVHQAQFAGFYVAREKGFFAAEPLDVAFLEGGNEVDMARWVITGKAQLGVMSPKDVLIKRAMGAPLASVAAICRRSAVALPLWRARASCGRPT